MEPAQNTENKKAESGWGAIIGIVILIAIFLAGGIYFFMREHQRFTAPPTQETINA